MKKTLLVLLISVAVAIYAQAKWDMKVYPNDSNVIQKDLDVKISQNYEPVGIEVLETDEETGIIIIYEKVDDSDLLGCKIKFYYDSNTNTVDEITREAKTGYLPMDLSHTSAGMLMLFVKYKDAEITEWIYDEAKPTYEDIGALLNKYMSPNREYVPTGISAWVDPTNDENNFYSMIFLKVPGLQIEEYNVYTFDGVENFEQGIYQLDEAGWSICGFSLYGDEWDVVVVKVGETIGEVVSEKKVTDKEKETTPQKKEIKVNDKESEDEIFDFFAIQEKPELMEGYAAKISEYITKNYPPLAKNSGASGKVIIKFICSKEGIPTDISVTMEKPADMGFGEVAVKAIEQARFKPGMQRNKPVAVRMSQKIDFKTNLSTEDNKNQVKETEKLSDNSEILKVWKGIWGDGSLTIKDVTDKSFKFDFLIANEKGHTGQIENGIASFIKPTEAFFYETAYPDYKMIFNLNKNNEIIVKQLNPKTGEESLYSPYSGAGISFSGVYKKDIPKEYGK